MKKIISLLMAAVLIFSFTACSIVKNPDPSDETIDVVKRVQFEGKENILKSWNDFLIVNDKIFSTIRWAATYIKDYCENPDIDSYRRALSAAGAVSTIIRLIEIPDTYISDADFASAAKKGIDVSFINAEFSALKDSKNSYAELWESISRDVATESFWSYGVEYLEKTAEVQLRQAQSNIDYYRYTTNYILLMLGENSFIPDACNECPAILSNDTEFITDISVVEKEISASLDGIEACISEHAKVESIQKANIYMMNNAVTSEDYTEIYSNALTWGKDKNVIPLPSWGALPVFYSSKSDGSEKIQTISSGDDLTEVPPDILLQYKNTEKSEFIEYAEFLYSLGYTPTGSGGGSYDGNEPMNLIFSLGDSAFSIDWKDNRATIFIMSADVALVPIWYYVYLNK